MTRPPKISPEELHDSLLSCGYNVPTIVLKLRTQDDRALAERWAEYWKRKDRAHGYARTMPAWLEHWRVA